MQASRGQAGAAAAGCPVHGGLPQSAGLQAGDELHFPMHKRVITQYSRDAAGAPELHLYYGDKEISFDEPALFAFGEALARQSTFPAGSATTWGGGYEWPRVRELLEQLLEGGILVRAQGAAKPEHPATGDGARPSPLPPALAQTPRSWVECEAITRELTGRAVELGYLELIVPIFRVAHMALDAEGRQVGEANVFPKPLRLDVPTKWRSCIYAGSRHQSDKPMNVTALKAMRTHWTQIMAALLRLRQAYLERFPRANAGWTVGDVERLSTLVLALPTYLLMRRDEPVKNGELHPALSSMFRVTDGLRMTTHQMLFVPVAEATLSPEDPITATEVYAYAERNYSFHSTHGVCAGPQAMIEEFLSVLIDGRPAGDAETVGLDPALEAALDAIEPAFDYGLYGLQAFVAVFSLWPAMTRTYAQLGEIVETWSGESSEPLTKLREHLRSKTQILKSETLHATEEWRANRERVYAQIYEQCGIGLGSESEKTLTERIAPVLAGADARLVQRLRSLVGKRLGAADADVERLVTCLVDYFLRARAILGVACESQQRINEILGRAQPVRAFSAADIDVHVLLQGDEARRLPYLLDELEELLGFRVRITRDLIEIMES
jgi:hypothetical protein